MPTKKTTSKKLTDTTAKKAPVKKTLAAKKTTPKSSNKVIKEVNVEPVETAQTAKIPFVRKPVLIAVVAALVVIAVLYYARGFFVAAIVNGQPISRFAVIHSLEQQGGKQALDSLITDAVIQQEAAKRHIAVSQSDIDGQIKTIESNLSKQGQTLDAALQAQGMTRQDLNDRIKIQVMVQKMVAPVNVTNAQAQDYLNKNKDSVPPGTTLESVKQQLQQQQLQTEEQTFVDNIRSKAKIAYWVNY